jgi:glutathione S-transferase
LRSRSQLLDIAHWGWIAAAGWAGVEIDSFPALKTWEERLAARPGVEKGRHVPDPHTIKELLKNKAEMDKKAAEAREWVQAGMKEDAAKVGK